MINGWMDDRWMDNGWMGDDGWWNRLQAGSAYQSDSFFFAGLPAVMLGDAASLWSLLLRFLNQPVVVSTVTVYKISLKWSNHSCSSKRTLLKSIRFWKGEKPGRAVLVRTCLGGFPPGLLDVLLVFVAEFDLQLLCLHLQVLLSVCQSFPGLKRAEPKLSFSRTSERKQDDLRPAAGGLWRPCRWKTLTEAS